MASASGSTGSVFPRWQIAVILGATGAIGLSLWYMRHYKRLKRTPSQPDAKSKTTSGTDSLDDSDTAAQPSTPLELAQQFKNEGNVVFKNGKYSEAIALYNKAIEACPAECVNDLATFYQNRAAAYEHLKKWSSVKGDCTKALELNQHYLKALLRRARACEVTKDYEQCLDDATALCLMQNFQDQSTILMADRVLRELGRKHAVEALANRKPLLPSRHFIKTYFSSFSEDPVYGQIKSAAETNNNTKGFARAKSAFLKGSYDEIIPACTEEIDSSESEAQFKMEALALRGTFHMLSGSFEEGLSDLTAVIDNEDVDVKIRVNCLIKRASYHIQLEKQDLCFKDFASAVELNPNISDIYHHRGQMYLLTDQTDKATQDFAKAVELNPDFPIAYIQKCYTDYRYAMKEKNAVHLNNALDDFQNAIKRFPSCVESYTMYAQVLADQQQFDKAEELYDKALKTEPDNANIFVQKALLLLQKNGNLIETINMMQQAIELDPLCSYAYETLGTIEVQRGNLADAVALFEKAVPLAKTELELAHLFSLKDAAASQLKVSKRLGVNIPLVST